MKSTPSRRTRVPAQPTQASPVEIKRALKSFENKKALLAKRETEMSEVAKALNADLDEALKAALETNDRPSNVPFRTWRRLRKQQEVVAAAEERLEFQKKRVRGLLTFAVSRSLKRRSHRRHREVWKLFEEGVEKGIVEKTDEILAETAAAEECDVRSEALKELVARTLPIIKKLARQNTTLDPEWAETRAVEGVWKAAKKFDPTKGASFTTYAYNWIFRETRTRSKADHALPTEWTVKLGGGDEMSILEVAGVDETDAPQSDFFRDLTSVMDEVEDEAREVFERRAMHDESYRQIAEEMGLSVSRVKRLYEAARSKLADGLSAYEE